MLRDKKVKSMKDNNNENYLKKKRNMEITRKRNAVIMRSKNVKVLRDEQVK